MKKKTSPEKEKKEDLSEQESQQEMMKVLHQLSNSGEAVYQILMKWETTNQLLEKINESIKDISLEEESEDSDDNEDEEDD